MRRVCEASAPSFTALGCQRIQRRPMFIQLQVRCTSWCSCAQQAMPAIALITCPSHSPIADEPHGASEPSCMLARSSPSRLVWQSDGLNDGCARRRASAAPASSGGCRQRRCARFCPLAPAPRRRTPASASSTPWSRPCATCRSTAWCGTRWGHLLGVQRISKSQIQPRSCPSAARCGTRRSR